MERYWTLKYLEQEGIDELKLSVFKTYPGTPPLARAEALPLVVSVAGAPELQRGCLIKVRLSSIDLMTLDVKADYLELCEPMSTSDQSQNTQLELEEEFEEDFKDAGAVPSVIAIDLDLDVQTSAENLEPSDKPEETIPLHNDSTEITP